jgi:hypothetical protein
MKMDFSRFSVIVSSGWPYSVQGFFADKNVRATRFVVIKSIVHDGYYSIVR